MSCSPGFALCALATASHVRIFSMASSRRSLFGRNLTASEWPMADWHSEPSIKIRIVGLIFIVVQSGKRSGSIQDWWGKKQPQTVGRRVHG